jgi:hypothetical protein
MTIFIMEISRTACTAAKSTAGNQSVVLAVRHVAAAACKTGEFDAGTTSGEDKNASVWVNTRWASPAGRSAQIRGAVSVHWGQNSLIH